MEKYLYVLIDSKRKTHYGAYTNDVEARKAAIDIENKEGIPKGSIDIYEIASSDIK